MGTSSPNEVPPGHPCDVVAMATILPGAGDLCTKNPAAGGRGESRRPELPRKCLHPAVRVLYCRVNSMTEADDRPTGSARRVPGRSRPRGCSCPFSLRKARMNWNILSQSRRRGSAPTRPWRARFLPRVDALEDRELLSATTSVFTIDQPSSSLTLSGTVGSSTIQQQGSGSLTTHYYGTVVSTWDLDGGTISFASDGSFAVAVNSGSWQPRPGGASGSAPANYGGRVTIILVTAQVAVRGLVV